MITEQYNLFPDSAEYVLAENESNSTLNHKIEMEMHVKSKESYRTRIIQGVGSERWSQLTFTGADDDLVIQPYSTTIPKRLIPVTDMNMDTDQSYGVHFYLHDYRTLHIFEHIDDYIPMLSRMTAVITADCSQYIDMPPYKRYEMSCTNKRIAAYLQSKNVPIIVNVAWSTPDSFEYAFDGLPTRCPISISSIGVKRYCVSKYLWKLGYEKAVECLSPTVILRYGERMPFEYDEISVYFDNERLKRLRNGRKR